MGGASEAAVRLMGMAVTLWTQCNARCNDRVLRSLLGLASPPRHVVEGVAQCQGALGRLCRVAHLGEEDQGMKQW